VLCNDTTSNSKVRSNKWRRYLLRFLSVTTKYFMFVVKLSAPDSTQRRSRLPLMDTFYEVHKRKWDYYLMRKFKNAIIPVLLSQTSFKYAVPTPFS
jgi:hypothetical protein